MTGFNPEIYKAHNASIQVIDQRFTQAKAEIATETGLSSGVIYETYVHARWRRLIEADKEIGFLPPYVGTDVCMNQHGGEAGYGEAGSIRYDVYIQDGDRLRLILEGKVGAAGLSKARSNILIERATVSLANILVFIVR